MSSIKSINHSTSPPELSGRIALVTGASSGLGQRFARVLAAAGATVIIAGRRESRLRQLANEITASGGAVITQVMDISDGPALPGLIEQLTREHGLIDILVNNAAMGQTGNSLDTPATAADELLFTNLRAPFILCNEIARHLITAQRPGNIVNLSSVGAYHYSTGTHAALYCACKAAIIRLTEALAMEWAQHGINVNAIAPGLFRTEMTDTHLAHYGDAILKRMPRKRAGEPAQLDSTLLYLLSPASEFITGICIRVDDAQFPR